MLDFFTSAGQQERIESYIIQVQISDVKQVQLHPSRSGFFSFELIIYILKLRFG